MALIDWLAHPVKLSVKTNARGGADAVIEYNGKDWVLLAGSKICTEFTPCGLNKSGTITQVKWAEEKGLLKDGEVKASIRFRKLSAANSFIHLSSCSYVHVTVADTKILLEHCLQDPTLYNKYIAHCEYYDKDWNVIGGDNKEQTDPVPAEEPNTVEPITQPQSLQDISTSDIINELASRIIDISKQWGG